MSVFQSLRAGLVVVVVIFATLLPVQAAPPEPKPGEKVFVGYVYGYEASSRINFGLYTHICHAFLTADGDGKLKSEKTVPSRDLTTTAHKGGAKVLISLGGWGWDEQFGSIVKNAQAEDRYVGAIMEIVDSADYDGIDLDWEYPDTKEEVVGFERLTRRFRKLLDELGQKKARPMLLTMAASSNPGTLSWLGKDFLLETMDWINVMTYDFAGSWTGYAGHNAPLFGSSKQPGQTKLSAEGSIKYLMGERGIPANRIAMGIPLYGRGFAVTEPYASTKGAGRTTYAEAPYRIVAGLADRKWTQRWDDEIRAPWLIAPDKATVIGYDDARSVAIKTEWAMKQGLRGVFFWEISQDRLPDGTNPLQGASRKAWDAGTSK